MTRSRTLSLDDLSLASIERGPLRSCAEQAFRTACTKICAKCAIDDDDLHRVAHRAVFSSAFLEILDRPGSLVLSGDEVRFSLSSKRRLERVMEARVRAFAASSRQGDAGPAIDIHAFFRSPALCPVVFFIKKIRKFLFP